MKDNPQPVTDAHVAFARAVVELARKHNADDIILQFRLTGGRRMFEGRHDPTRMTATWHSGRHDVEAQITLRAEAQIQVGEKSE